MVKLLSCAINAACMAMVDAGFPMKCLVCAVTCTMNESGEIQLDPTSEQEKVRMLGREFTLSIT